ncbi:hypothetical protein FIV07_27855 (plasmid) [Mycobacterium sp. THAF192]|nr:hypothetical protein FIV07_27855 [Mycobacterium sp. THAF192]
MTATTEHTRGELARVRAELQAARRQLAQAAIDYAATPDGAAETYRRFELATDPAQRSSLQETYLAGLQSASQEYEQRLARGAATDRDGYLQVIAVGDFASPVTRALITHRIMATYRSGPAALASQKATVHLMLLEPDDITRRRTRVSTPAPLGVVAATLADIITTAWGDTATRTRLTDFLGNAAESLDRALTALDRR